MIQQTLRKGISLDTEISFNNKKSTINVYVIDPQMEEAKTEVN